MKYYSEITKKPYDTIEDLETAEKKAEEAKQANLEKRNARTKAAKEVEDAINAAQEAQKKADEAKRVAGQKLNAFCREYGAYHTSYIGWSDVLDEFLHHLLW